MDGKPESLFALLEKYGFSMAVATWLLVMTDKKLQRIQLVLERIAERVKSRTDREEGRDD